MIERISISNFRGFSHLELHGLRRINVLVGRNSSGKTSILEAIFLSSGAAAPNQVFQLRALRHLGQQIQISADARSYTALWSDLFHWFQTEKPIVIDAEGTHHDSRSLSISFTEDTSPVLPMGEQPIASPALPQIEFIWKRNGNAPTVVRPVMTPLGMNIQGASTDHFPTIYFSPSSPDTPRGCY